MHSSTGRKFRVLNSVQWPLLLLPLGMLLAVIFAFAIQFSGFLPWQSETEVASAPIAGPANADEMAILLKTDTLPISKMEAEAINAARAPDLASLVSAKPFVLPAGTAASGPVAGTALRCLTQAIYYEAASESDSGQRAVAQVVLNRMRHPAFPKSVCGVVYQGWQLPTGCQFSFTCDGSLARMPSKNGWARAQRHAAAALAGWVEPSVGLATHYHANYVVPYWASSLDKAKTIGAHLFYVMRGVQKRPSVFSGSYDAASESLPVGQLADIDLLTLGDIEIPGSEFAAPIVETVAPKNRTEVREDMLGGLAAPQTNALPLPNPPGGGPRADETSGKLGIDERVGTLTPR